MKCYKPYPFYKESGVEWLPKIPSKWESLSLKSVFHEGNDRGGEKSELLAVSQKYGVLPQSQLMEITDRKLSASSSDDWSNYRRVDKGNIVYNKMRLWQGAIGLSAYKGIVSPAYVVLKSVREISGQFYEYFFKTPVFVSEAGRYSQGLCDDMNSCRYEDFKNAKIIFPPLDEQQAITAFLDRETARIDALVNVKTHFIELLREKRQALITHAVTKGLDPNVKIKDSGVNWLGQLPEHWKVSKLGYEAWVRARLGWKGLKAEEYVDDGFVFLATPNIKGLHIDFENVNYIDEIRFKESPEIQIAIGDVLLAKDGSTLGTVNVVRVLPRAATVNSSIAVITPQKNVCGLYLYYLFKSSYLENTIQMIKGGMGVPHLFQADLIKFGIPVPPLEEQILICDYLDHATTRIDALITKTERSIELLKEHRSAIITAAVTGQIDLREVKG